jgi:hypothetical protein
VTVESIRKAFGISECLRAAAANLSWQERIGQVNFQVCVCNASWDPWMRSAEEQHASDCIAIALLRKAEQIEAEAIDQGLTKESSARKTRFSDLPLPREKAGVVVMVEPPKKPVAITIAALVSVVVVLSVIGYYGKDIITFLAGLR